MDFEEALELGQSIVDDADRVPTKGASFAESVANKATDIMQTIEQTQRVTEKQEDALRNMRHGLNRWLNSDRDYEP